LSLKQMHTGGVSRSNTSVLCLLFARYSSIELTSIYCWG